MFTKKELEIIRAALHIERQFCLQHKKITEYNELTALIGKATTAHSIHAKRIANALRIVHNITIFQEECAQAEYTDTEQAGALLIEARHALVACTKPL